MSAQRMVHLRQRLAVSVMALFGLFIALVFASYPLLQPLFVAIVAGIIGIAMQEYYRMVQKMDTEPVSTAAIFCSTIYVFAIYLRTQDPQWHQFPILTVAFSFVTLFVHFFFKGSHPLLNFPVTVFGFVWLTIPLSLMVSVMFFLSPRSSSRWTFLVPLPTHNYIHH